MPRMQHTEIEFLHADPVTAVWTGPSGTVHTVTGQLYEHVGRIYLTGRRLTWLLDAGAEFYHSDPTWLRGQLSRPASPLAA